MNQENPPVSASPQSATAASPQIDSLAEKFAKGLTETAVQIAGLFLLFIFTSAACATDPFFRKNMGERYFTVWRAMFGAAGWGLCSLFATIMGVLEANFKAALASSGDDQVKLHFFLVPSIVGGLIVWGYIILSAIHLSAIHYRRAMGEVWYSRSRGESLFGRENKIRDLIIEIIVVVPLWFAAKPLAAFFFLSRLLGYASDWIAWSNLYNRYLDIQDAKIEAEFMEVVLREGFPPRQTAGLYMPLPGGFYDKRRANLARVLVGRAENVPPRLFTPPPSQNVKERAKFSTITRLTKNAIRAILAKKRIAFIVVVVLIVLAAAVWGTSVLRKHGAKTPQQPAASRPVSSESYSQRPETPPPPPTPAVAEATSTPQPQLLAAPVSQIDSTPPKADDTAAAAQAALEEQRRQERERQFEQLQKDMNEISEETSNFQMQCATRLYELSNNVSQASLLHRAGLRAEYKKALSDIKATFGGQNIFLDDFRFKVQSDSANPQSDPRQRDIRLRNVVALMRSDDGGITRRLDKLESDIASHTKSR